MKSMRGPVRLTIGLLLSQLLVAGIAEAEPMEPDSWSSVNCTGATWTEEAWRRSDAKSYAGAAAQEGFEWGGGCYKLNNYDDTPGEADSGGEGADCSGFAFRAWALPSAGSSYRYYQHTHYEHGPYGTWDYETPVTSDPFYRLSAKTYSATQYMDGLVYDTGDYGHTGLIYSEGNSGYDWIVEAKSDAIGSRVAWLDYRSQSRYVAFRRENWTPDGVG
jgi:hypothetical protein